MFGMGMHEIILILAVALIVIGPKKLPDLAKSLGRAFGEFKKATTDFKESISMDSTLNEVKDEFKDLGRKVNPLSTSSTAEKSVSKDETATETQTVEPGSDAIETEKSGETGTDTPDQKTSAAEASSDPETEITGSESAGTEKTAGIDTESVSDKSTKSSIDSDSGADLAKAPETAGPSPDDASPDTAPGGPLKDA